MKTHLNHLMIIAFLFVAVFQSYAQGYIVPNGVAQGSFGNAIGFTVIQDPSDGDFTGNSSFRIISYEIPAMLMIYSQLGEKIYINGSMGPTLDMFASDIQTSDYYFNQVSFRRKICFRANSFKAYRRISIVKTRDI